MKTRRQPSTKLAIALGAYYEYQCVVTGSPGYELHHLDDDPSNSTFANMIPLDGDLNIRLRDMANEAKKGRPVVPVSLLASKTLLAHADFCAGIWKTGSAYGAARLAGFAARYQKNWEESVMLSCEAIYHARHRLNYDLIEDTLRRSILPEISRSLPPEIVFRLCREIGGIYAEHGRNKESLEAYKKTQGVKIDSTSAMAAFLRRQATTEAALAGAIGVAEEMMKQADRLNVGDINHIASMANSYSWILIASDRHGKALERIEPIVELLDKKIFRPGAAQPVALALTGWNAGEVYHNYALALFGAKPHSWERKMKAAIAKAESIFQKSGAAFYEIKEGLVSDLLSRSGISSPYAKVRKLPASLDEVMKDVFKAIS